MFGMSLTEIMMILVIALVVMGPDKIPEAARFMGKVMREIRKASNLLRDAVALEDMDAFAATTLPQSQSVGETSRQVELHAPDPTRDVKMATMSPYLSRSPESFELAAATPPVTHREVYLHVPYDETY